MNEPANTQPREWFEEPTGPEGGAGLRFSCTMCGNCCSGPPGFVLVNDEECAALAARFGVPVDQFIAMYTHVLPEGRSLRERLGPRGWDCVFLDRETIPGKAVCGVYLDRPRQCRTWPFWKSLLKSADAWASAKRICPGMDVGVLVPVEEVRIRRAIVEI